MQRRRDLIGAGLAACSWAMLWVAPWDVLLPRSPYLRVWIALLVLCAPGLAIDAVLRRSRAHDVGERLPVAFAISLAATSAFGLVGRLLGVRLATVDASLLLAGATVVGCATAIWLRNGPRKPSATGGSAWQTAGLAIVLIAGAALCTATPIAADDFTHGARIAAFQQQPLGFARLAYAGDTSITPRYWVALWPLTESLLAHKAGVTGLQLLQLLGPALAVLALLALRCLGLALGLSRELALLAVIAQVTALSLLGDRLQPGRSFFGRLGEDKFLAIFLLAPVACALLARLLERVSARRVAAALLCWVALALTHPTSLGMTAIVAVLFCLLDLGVRASRAALVAIAIVVATTAPVAALRLLPHPQYRHLHFDVASSEAKGELTVGRTWRISTTGEGRFVGVAEKARPPALLAIGALILLVASCHLRSSLLARYVTSAMLLPAVAVIPYTGWLLGLLVTPFHLWRTLGLAPFGLGAALVFQSFLAWCGVHRSAIGRRVAYATVLLACIGIVASTSLASKRERRALGGRISSWIMPSTADVLVARCIGEHARTRFEIADLLAVATIIDSATTDRPVVIGDHCINDLLPSISAKATMVGFRLPIEMLNHGDFTIDEATRVWETHLALFDGKLSTDAAKRFLDESEVDLIVVTAPAPWLEAVARTTPLAEVGRSGPIRVLQIDRSRRSESSP